MLLLRADMQGVTDPSSLEVCRHADGTPVQLGSGGFGAVRTAATLCHAQQLVPTVLAQGQLSGHCSIKLALGQCATYLAVLRAAQSAGMKTQIAIILACHPDVDWNAGVVIMIEAAQPFAKQKCGSLQQD